MGKRILVVALAVFLVGSAAGPAGAEGRVERNVVFGMYSGLALLMDVYHPENPNGYGIVFISGSGWTRELGLDATPLKESGQEEIYAVPLAAAGYTVFGINHRASPRFRHPRTSMTRSAPCGSFVTTRTSTGSIPNESVRWADRPGDTSSACSVSSTARGRPMTQAR